MNTSKMFAQTILRARSAARLKTIKSKSHNSHARSISAWVAPAFQNEPVVRQFISHRFYVVTPRLVLMCQQKDYVKNSPERNEITHAIKNLKRQLPVNIPLVVNGIAVSMS